MKYRGGCLSNEQSHFIGVIENNLKIFIMAEITENENAGKKVFRKQRAKRHTTRIDMTPMVDLMSLLITFFMLTTAFSKPKIMEIVLPNDDGPTGEVAAPRTLNLLLSGDDKVYYYVGKPPMNDKDVAESVGRIQKINYGKDGIRRTVLKMNMSLFEKVDSISQKIISGENRISQDSLLALMKIYKRKDKRGPIVMIKADKKAKYRNIVDAIDEMAICSVARYAMVDMNEYEQKMLANAPQ